MLTVITGPSHHVPVAWQIIGRWLKGKWVDEFDRCVGKQIMNQIEEWISV